MKCPRCRARVSARARFCSACGAPQGGAADGSLWAEALRLFELGDYGSVLDLLRPLLGSGSEGGKALTWSGHALFFSGRELEARACYEQALARDPGLWDAHYQLGSLAFSHGAFGEAVAHFERVAALEADLQRHPLGALFNGDARRVRAQTLLYLGLSRRQSGDALGAEKALREAMALDPGDPLAVGVLGELLRSAGLNAEAVEIYRAAMARVKDEQGLRGLRNDLGVALFQAGDLEGAAEAFKSVLQTHPDDANAIHNLGMLYLKQGLGEELGQDLREFLKVEQPERLLLSLTRSLVEGAREEVRRGFADTGMIGNSPRMREVADLVLRAAQSEANVLLLGANGTGKELAARSIHRLSRRAQGPFVAVNCAALPETLLESELFGYERGAFTGALASKPGRFELAAGGTLFLDEIGDLQPALQVKLLRAVQEKSFERLGGGRTLHSDFRLVAATNRDLRRLVLEGRFREDLFYRLFVFPIELPALKERREDIPALAEHFLRQAAGRAGKRFRSIAPEALELLAAHDWPGNVRELENLIERAVALYDAECLEAGHLHFDRPAQAAMPAPAAEAGEDAGGWSELERAERDALRAALARHGQRVGRTAEALGLSRRTLERKMRRFGLLGPRQK